MRQLTIQSSAAVWACAVPASGHDPTKLFAKPRIVLPEGKRWFCALMLFASLLACTVHRLLPADSWAGSEYGMPAVEFQQHHRITSVFVPPGYAVCIALGRILMHGDAGLFAANLAIYLAWLASIWVLLRQLGVGSRQAALLGFGFAVYPDILFTLNKAVHTTLTSLMLLAFVSCALWIARGRSHSVACAAMVPVLAAAMLSRPNLLLLVPAFWIVIWQARLPRRFWRAVSVSAGACVLYAVATLTIHGAVYWPQMGPYNLFAGANEFTRADMERSYDNAAEGSIIPALHARGIEAYHDWNRPDNLPGDNETRNLRFRSVYVREALYYMRQHPIAMLRLTWLKTVTFFRPDLQIHPWYTVAGLVKVLAACSMPVWLLGWRWRDTVDFGQQKIVALVAALFVLPHLLTISAPRYRIPLDVLCFVAVAGMVCSRYFTSSPRPAA